MDSQAEFHPAGDAVTDRLRPLTTGEVVDRTFSLSRSNFWLFCGVALVPALVSLCGSSIRIGLDHMVRASHSNTTYAVLLGVFTIVWSLVTLGVYGSSQAASTFAVSSVYLDRQVTVGAAYQESKKHWFRYPALIVVQFLSAGWVTIVIYIVLAVLAGVMAATRSTSVTIAIALVGFAAFFSFIYSGYRFCKVALAMPASVMEGLGVRAALKRSRALTADRKWRIFLIFCLIGVLYLVLWGGLSALVFASMRGKLALLAAQLVSMAVVFFASLLLQPIGAVSMTLVYFDERVRREAFDIEFMMQNLVAQPVEEPGSPAEGVAEA
ncbi:glycerophosphoryl diester phosphodiesterase membrane domain-containing protein [Terriglobus sp. 2YAB30_2]|uniref:hypothetical protein n=1 Tax=unclassified Terriglobus TaxID=2628988 RepID=UPI003F95252D